MPSSQVSLIFAGSVNNVSLGIGGVFFHALLVMCLGGYGNVGMGLRVGDVKLIA